MCLFFYQLTLIRYLGGGGCFYQLTLIRYLGFLGLFLSAYVDTVFDFFMCTLIRYLGFYEYFFSGCFLGVCVFVHLR